MKKNLVILLTLGILICLTATVVADEIKKGNITEVRQHPNRPNVWQVATKAAQFGQSKVKDFILENTINLEEWDLTEEWIVEKAASSLKKRVLLKQQEEEDLVAAGWFNFYQPIKKLVVEKSSNTFSVKIIIEKDDTIFGTILVIWIVSMLLYYFFLIIVFKRSNSYLFIAAVASASVAASASATVAAAFVAIAFAATFAFAAFVAAEDKNKKVMFICLLIYYSVSLLLLYSVSDIAHTIIPMVAVPLVFVITWKLVKYKL